MYLRKFTRKRIILISILVMVGAVYIYLAQNVSRQMSEDSYRHFDSTSISGRIKYIGIKHHGVELRIEGEKESFVFYPYTKEDGLVFEYLAKKEDSVFKPKHHDTFKLITNNKEYYYTFKKF